jgi:hypothetical protein
MECTFPEIDDLVAEHNLLYSQPALRANYRERGVAFAKSLDWTRIV